MLKDKAALRSEVKRLLRESDTVKQGDFGHVVRAAMARRETLLGLAERHQTPFYAFDTDGLRDALRRFRLLFDGALPGHVPYYAVKSNPHPFMLAEAVRAGYGLDVSSGRELQLALAAGATKILFSGPGKSDAELRLALKHRDRVIVNLDSFGELARLGAVSARARKPMRAGVRIFTQHHGSWNKFGIPLEDLGKFFREAEAHAHVDLCGVQFHLSWNRSAEPYARILAALGKALKKRLTPAQRARIRFIDVGGGYKPHALEGYFPKDHPLGMLAAAVDEQFDTETQFELPWIQKESVPLASYALTLREAVRKHVAPHVKCNIFTEPGRIVSTWSMHLVMRVVDVKRKDAVILDGGIHMVGWERYLQIYAPVVNLTHPDTRERKVHLFGSLCDPEDTFGALCHAAKMELGDVIVVPFQGAYTYGVAQNFIRAIPEVHKLPASGAGSLLREQA
jgi:diaminopimelate decarboxylase